MIEELHFEHFWIGGMLVLNCFLTLFCFAILYHRIKRLSNEK